MDQKTLTIMVYGMLISGIPLFGAKIIWFIPSSVLGGILKRIAARLDVVVDAAVEGLISILLACLIFQYFNFKVTLAVPIIVCTINIIWRWVEEEALRVWPSAAAIVVGFLLYPQALAFLVSRFEIL